MAYNPSFLFSYYWWLSWRSSTSIVLSLITWNFLKNAVRNLLPYQSRRHANPHASLCVPRKRSPLVGRVAKLTNQRAPSGVCDQATSTGTVRGGETSGGWTAWLFHCSQIYYLLFISLWHIRLIIQICVVSWICLTVRILVTQYVTILQFSNIFMECFICVFYYIYHYPPILIF